MASVFFIILAVCTALFLLGGMIVRARRFPASPFAQRVRRRLVPISVLCLMYLASAGFWMYWNERRLNDTLQRLGEPPYTPDGWVIVLVTLLTLGAATFFFAQLLLAMREHYRGSEAPAA
jgi:hypothetical protein